MFYGCRALPVAVAVFCLASSIAAPSYAVTTSCTAATLTGSYGLSINSPSLVVSGLYTFDGVNRIAGEQTNVSSGNPPRIFGGRGSYKVNTDCTIIINMKYFQGGSLAISGSLSGVIVNNGAKIITVQTSSTAGPAQNLEIFEAVH